MSATQAQTVECPASFEAPRFAFLSQPPPQKRRVRPFAGAPLPAPLCSPPPVPHGQPSPALRRKWSNANSGILAWASLVQPGSPAPVSPHRRLSISSTSSRRSSISRLNRRPSISHGRAPSGSSFVHIVDSPTLPQPQRTPSTGKFDLTTLGYTSIFIQFPKTPTTPSPYLRQYHEKHEQPTTPAVVPEKPLTPGPLSAAQFVNIPIPPIPQTKQKGMKRFRSLSILRPRSSKAKSQTAAPSSPSIVPPSPARTTLSTKSANAAAVKAAKKQQLAATAAAITRRKQAKYAQCSKTAVRPPPTLANELALMQFADGGSLESHAKRVMEAQAKAARGCGTGAGVGVADVHRDGKGGMWWDEDEEMEYAPLLGGKTVQETMKESRDAMEMEVDWEEFTDAVSPLTPFHNTSRLNHLAAAASVQNQLCSPTRSRASISTQDSDLDPRRMLPLPELEDPRVLVDDRALASHNIGGAGMSVLSLPSRPRRALPHLRQPATFLVDAAAFVPRSPTSAQPQPKTPLTPTSFLVGSGAQAKASVQLKPKVRRRPAPLKLASSAYGSGRSRRSPAVAARRAALASPVRAVVVVPSPKGVEKTKREFIEGSFAPAPVVPAVPASVLEAAQQPQVHDMPTDRSSKRKGVLGLFALTRRTD
ncbi:hypothetical protein BDN70DRAFT_913753 [Pholiota conissans]|uniref:Uncharacterized protein n=1 Tax=Pholiota conissans TaxID=109636 RepID=A0A9P5Z2G9_9AGAR|nr:hypothetical protein BDN70DRAFT_913753 [Pholiota conissans]